MQLNNTKLEHDNRDRKEPVHSMKLKAGRKRTYFFDVRPTKSNDYYLTITESKKRFNADGYERHKIFIYKEDLNKFMNAMEKSVNHIKTDLMPEYDFDSFRREDDIVELPTDQNASYTKDESSESTSNDTAGITDEIDDEDLKW